MGQRGKEALSKEKKVFVRGRNMEPTEESPRRSLPVSKEVTTSTLVSVLN